MVPVSGRPGAGVEGADGGGRLSAERGLLRVRQRGLSEAAQLRSQRHERAGRYAPSGAGEPGGSHCFGKIKFPV